MSSVSDRPRPSIRFRDKLSHLKEKFKDKAIKHNITLFVHKNLTIDDDNQTSHRGFRERMHGIKETFKNKTHYESIKDKIKHKIDDKLDLHDNKTYPKGFYDSLFSPDTENDVYLQTALICLWIIAVLCIIPTIIVIFLPARKKKSNTTSTNMIFFHVFLCELFYLMYILLAMINVAKDFRLGPLFCDFANYGMYVTIPIMQFALLFLSLERLSKHFNLTTTWLKIFTKPYLIQVILCVIWIILIASLITFMFIRKQFSFSFFKDKFESLAPPIVGDVVKKLASRRHHCSVDGRLSSVFKTIIIILFIILIVKPILFSLGFNLLTPFCCKKKRKEAEKQGDRRTTNLVTIFLVLNLLFSFPFYFASMFNSVLTRIDSTKDTFTIILKICFILRITNIIFECLAFYIFERNSWSCLSKLFYYGTCKKFPVFNATPDDDKLYTKDPDVQDLINKTRYPSDDDDEENAKTTAKKKRIKKKVIERTTETEPDDDDGAMDTKKTKKKPETPVESDAADEEKLVVKQKKQPIRKTSIADEEEEAEPVYTTRRKSKTKKVDSDNDDEDETTKYTSIKRTSQTKKQENDNDNGDEGKHYAAIKRKSQIQRKDTDNDEDEENEPEQVITTKRKSRTKKPASDVDDDDDEEKERKIATTTKRKSRPKVEIVEEEEIIEKPKSKPRPSDVEIRIPNGKAVSHRPSSATNNPKTTKSASRHSTSAHTNPKRRSTQSSPSPNDSEIDAASNASQASSKMIQRSTSPKRVKKPTRTTRPSSNEHKKTRPVSPNDQRSRQHRTESSPSKPRHITTKNSVDASTKARKKSPRNSNTQAKKSKKDRRTRILEMSDEV